MSKEHTPGPLESLNNIGNMSSPVGRHKMSEKASEYNPDGVQVLINLLGFRAAVVNNPDDGFAVLRHPQVIRASLQQDLKVIGPLIGEEGWKHAAARSGVEHLLNPRALAHYLPTIIERTNETFSTWPVNKSLDPLPEIHELYNNIVADTVFKGANMPQELVKLIPEMLPSLVEFGQHDITPITKYIPKRGRKNFEKKKDNFYRLFSSYISTQLETENPSVINHITRKLRDGFIKQGVDLTKKEEEGEFLKTVVETVDGLWIAATETTANPTTFALEFLSQHPDKFNRLREETLHVLNGRSPDKLTMEDLENMPYAKACFFEALRLMPPVENTLRQIEPDKNKNGAMINHRYYFPNMYVSVNIRHILRNPKTWGPDADKFRPERFLGLPADHSLIKILMIAFINPSKHGCAGEALAIMEGTTVVGLAGYHFTGLSSKSKFLPEVYGATVSPNKFSLEIQR